MALCKASNQEECAQKVDPEKVTVLLKIADASEVTGPQLDRFLQTPNDAETLILLLSMLGARDRQRIGKASVEAGLVDEQDANKTFDPGGQADVVADTVRLVFFIRARFYSLVSIPILEMAVVFFTRQLVPGSIRDRCGSSLAWIRTDGIINLLLAGCLVATLCLVESGRGKLEEDLSPSI